MVGRRSDFSSECTVLAQVPQVVVTLLFSIVQEIDNLTPSTMIVVTDISPKYLGFLLSQTRFGGLHERDVIELSWGKNNT